MILWNLGRVRGHGVLLLCQVEQTRHSGSAIFTLRDTGIKEPM